MKFNHTEFTGNQTCLKVKPYFPGGFQGREEKVPSGCSPFCQVSVITENLFTKCTQSIFQEFKAYFIGSSGHWKIVYSFPRWFGALHWHTLELTHLASHLDFPDAQKEVFKPRDILDGELHWMFPNTRIMKTAIHIQRWGEGCEDMAKEEEEEDRGSNEKRKRDVREGRNRQKKKKRYGYAPLVKV